MGNVSQREIRSIILEEEFDENRIPITQLIRSAVSSLAKNRSERQVFVNEASDILSMIVKNSHDKGLVYYRTKLFDRARKAYQTELKKHGLNISFKVTLINSGNMR